MRCVSEKTTRSLIEELQDQRAVDVYEVIASDTHHRESGQGRSNHDLRCTNPLHPEPRLPQTSSRNLNAGTGHNLSLSLNVDSITYFCNSTTQTTLLTISNVTDDVNIQQIPHQQHLRAHPECTWNIT